MTVRLLLLVLWMTTVAAAESNPRKVLFFDLWKLDYWDNVELRQGNPEWVRECEYIDPSAPNGSMVFPFVWKNEQTGKWQAIYSVKWSPFTLMAAVSDDGIHWEPLAVPDSHVPESVRLAPNHLLTAEGTSGGGVYVDPQQTDGYRFRILGRRHGQSAKRYDGEGVTFVSKDGLHWEMKTGGHWNWLAEDWLPEPPTFTFWRASDQTHVLACRPGWGDRRQCLRTTKDFKTWSEPRLEFQPDALDTDGPIGLYGLPVHPVGNGAGYVGLLWIFHNSNSRPVDSFNQFFGVMDAQLTFSYDGHRFFRGKREPFLQRNAIPLAGSAQIRPTCIVETEDEIRIYSGANRGAHGRERSEQRQKPDENLASLMLHRLRKDGWMFLESRGDWGRFQTKPFALFSPEIKINANAAYGEVRFQLTNEASETVEGFSFEDCKPLRGSDALAHSLRWKNADLKSVLNRPLRLDVEFRQANIYAFEMAHHFLDAQDLWLLKDGEPVPALRFDF